MIHIYASIKSRCSFFLVCFSSLFVDEVHKYMYAANILDNSQTYGKYFSSILSFQNIK